MKTETKRQIKLFFPICLETLCFMLSGMVDTLMLSSVSDEAVGAVGTANTYINMFIMMFAVITTGMNAVMAQYIGANRQGIAYQAKQIGLTFNIILGTGLSIFMFFFSGDLLNSIGIASNLHAYARDYLKIVGSFTFINASLQIFSGYLRSFGHTKQPLLGTLSANILNIILNSIFLFHFHYGVIGVAIAIMTGWRVGAGQFDECDRATKNSAILAVCISAGLETVFALLSYHVVGIFTDDPVMISLVSKLLYIDIILEIGRATNIVYVNALKASGDAIFPSVMGMIFMLSVAAGGTWIFGVQLGLGAVGAYIGMAADECIRAVAMYFRWRTNKWQEHGLVQPVAA